MVKNILVILGHPTKDSLCGSLADSYEMGAKASKNKTRRINLGDITFDPILKKRYKEIEPSEEIVKPKDLESARKDIKWADHIVFVFPTWWASMPALMKGFLDRIFIPGFGYKFKDKKSLLPEKLFSGKTSHLLITMDSPPLYYRFIVKEPGYRLMKDTLRFMGVTTTRNYFGSVKLADEKKIARWIRKAHRLGEKVR